MFPVSQAGLLALRDAVNTTALALVLNDVPTSQKWQIDSEGKGGLQRSELKKGYAILLSSV